MMPQTLQEMMRDTMRSALKRKSLTTCSRWAESCRVMGPPVPGVYSFKHTPWTREMHDSSAPMNIGQKSAQAGYSETVLNRTFYKIDIERVDCLYVLPSKTPDASDFSAARFDPALELSEHLSGLFSDVKNVGHKRAGSSNLYIRGSNARGGLKSIPVGFLVLDEFDEMCQENIPLAIERLSGQFSKQIWEISTPTVPGHGINKEFQKSTMEHFMFKCPSCSQFIEFNFDNLVVTGVDLEDPKLKDSYFKCVLCQNKIPHNKEAKQEYLSTGLWKPTAEIPDYDIRGFYVNQFYSSTISPAELARAYLLAQIDPASEQEFFNSKLGVPHIVDGAKLSMGHFEPLLKPYRKADFPPIPQGLITMGVDQGKRLHYEIDLWYIERFGPDINVNCVCKVLAEGACIDFEELDKLMRSFNVSMCVIDANPETRKAFEFATRFTGSVKLNYYSKASGRNIRMDAAGAGKDYKILVDRTSWMDMALSRFYNGTIQLPIDTSLEYKTHLIEPTRVYKKDSDGNNIGTYVNDKADHFAHARTYAEIALPLAAARRTNKNIEVYL